MTRTEDFMKQAKTFMDLQHSGHNIPQTQINARLREWLKILSTESDEHKERFKALDERHKGVLTAFENQNIYNQELLDSTDTLVEHLQALEKVVPALAEVAQQTIDTDRSQNEAIKGLIDRLSFLETMLKDNEIHEVHCNVMAVARHNARGQSYMYPQPCNCWLNHPDDDLTS